jgi:electron transport complex protein RnfA
VERKEDTLSYIGIAVNAVFVANAFLTYGLGIPPRILRDGRGSIHAAMALAVVNSLGSAMLWGLRTLVLEPFRLESIDLLLFAVIVVPCMKAFFKTVPPGENFLSRAAALADDSIVSSLVFGIALTASRSGFTLLEALAASAASGIGYWAANALLESIRERLELCDVPRAFRGSPSMLVSAGLVAMAFMGIDSILAKNLAG